MGTEAQALSAGYPLMRYGLAEYNAVIDYQPKTENAKSVPETYRFIASNIKGCYVSWSRSLPSGEVRIGDDIYLSIPNGWDERLCYYPWYTGHRYWQYNQWDYPEQNYENSSITPKGARNNESVYRYYHGNETNLDVYINKNRFTDKLLVWYKKALINLPKNEDLSPTIINPAPPTDNRTMVRMKIFITNDGDIATFNTRFVVRDDNQCNSVTYTYIFGDGATRTFTQADYDTPISHQYSSAGYYVVDINLESFSTNDDYLYLRVEDNNKVVITDYTDDGVLSSLYIDTPYYILNERIHLDNCGHLDYFYLSSSNYFYDIFLMDGTVIENLYLVMKDPSTRSSSYELYGDDAQYAGVVCIGCSGLPDIETPIVRNIYLNSYIYTINFNAEFDFSYLVSVYSYALTPIRVIDAGFFNHSIFRYDYSQVQSSFYVKPAVVSEVMELNFGLNVSVF